jgi:hypothetical protein
MAGQQGRAGGHVEATNRGQGGGSRIVAALASPVVAAAVAAIFWGSLTNRTLPPGLLPLLTLLSAAGGLAGLFGLRGMWPPRKKWPLLLCAVLGVCGNGFNGYWCIFALFLKYGGEHLG